MKTNKIIASAASLAVLAMSVSPPYNVYAASKSVTWDGDISSVSIVRSIPNGYGNIANRFEYTITADSTNPTGATGAPTVLGGTFNGGTSLSMSLDFASMKFETVGDYSYTISETSSANPTVYPLDTKSYIATIYVRNNADLSGLKASFIVKDVNQDKVSGNLNFGANANYTNIGLGVNVDGNTADPNKCFEYTVSLEGVADKYTFDSATTCEGNPTTVGNGDKIYLRHGDIATIGLDGANSQIPVGTNYSITRDGEDDYTTSIDGDEKTTANKTAGSLDGSDFDNTNRTNITEYLNKEVPKTGAAFGTTMFIVLALAAAGGLYIFSKKKNDQEA